jgi:hypothetical protein
MAPNASNDDDGFFNDLSRQPRSRSGDSGSPQEQGANGEENAPRTKRIACVICRKRKLKCDGKRPKCATCDRLGHNCAYDEVRRKSGPKRGYVKDLEARLGLSSPSRRQYAADVFLQHKWRHSLNQRLGKPKRMDSSYRRSLRKTVYRTLNINLIHRYRGCRWQKDPLTLCKPPPTLSCYPPRAWLQE